MPIVNPEILTWARTTAGMSLDEAAKAIDLKQAHGISGADRLAAIEGGEEPSRSLLVRMAKEYRRSLLVFYLAEPPKKGDRGKDFRTVPGAEPPTYNPLLDALIRDIKGRHSVLKSVLEDTDAKPLQFVGSASMRLATDTLAKRITEQLDFSLDEFRRRSEVEATFAYLRSKIEQAGIFVLLAGNLGSHHTNIPVDTFRGYAIADDIAPLIVINDQDAKSAWSFTALHEVVHLWLGTTGVSGWTPDLATERYCNDVAGEILLPASENDSLVPRKMASLDQLKEHVSQAAASHRVSRAMMAYRLFQLRVITQRTYDQLSAYFRQQWLDRKERDAVERKGRPGGPSYYVVTRYRLGNALLGVVSRSLGDGLLTHTKAAQVLGVKARNVDPLLFPTPPKPRGAR
jgi:Zn-dependent peptidase ImmA (M78 family)